MRSSAINFGEVPAEVLLTRAERNAVWLEGVVRDKSTSSTYLFGPVARTSMEEMDEAEDPGGLRLCFRLIVTKGEVKRRFGERFGDG